MTRLGIPSRLPFYILAAVILLIGIALILQRHWVYDVPLIYGETQTIWSVEAKVEFTAEDKPVQVTMSRPSNQKGFTILKEAAASPGYGLHFLEGPQPKAQWTIRNASGKQVLFYRAEILASEQEFDQDIAPPSVPHTMLPKPFDETADAVLAKAYSASSDNFSFTRELLRQFELNGENQQISLLRNHYSESLPTLITKMLHKAKIPAGIVYGLELEDGRRRQSLVPVLRVWNGNDHQLFFFPADRYSGLSIQRDAPLLLWQKIESPIVEVSGGKQSSIHFSMIKREESTFANIAQNLSSQYDFLNFSIHSLPIEEQAMFKTILLIPIGALIVCLLRIFVGIRTSGTFMPVLIALAFIQTSLVTGLVGFILVVTTGLLIRSYLSRLNLLLVARITAVIISVIAIISVFSVLAFKLGLTEGLKITFFPMIILSWTIERMSILWEEEGGREVMVQGSGSLLTAVLVYWAMNDPWIRHLTFNFIGIQFVVLSCILLLGSYTGYRLLELTRFKVFSK
ncbi:inactive transglutaminase family protein [Bermanella sp. R86510]|uniref:inactive transglutaminase family protein n=1 Tax=unclassified Bermanella TaxID=2627862 RepID=UPI0037C6439C